MQRNENKKGYKKTKVGWIPVEWECRDFGSFTKWSSGGTPLKANPEYWNGDIPWISAKSMYTTRLSTSNLKITRKGLKAGSRLAPKNSLLLLVRGSMLFKKIPIGIAEIDVAFNQDVKSIQPNKTTVSPEYLLNWFLGNEHKILGMVGGTGIGAGKLDLDELKAMNITLPPLPEQKAIADMLGCWDKAIEKLELKIEKKKKIKKGLQQRLLSGKLRLLGEKNRECGIENSELGLPAGWKVVRLGDVGTTYGGLSGKTKTDFGKGKPYIPYLTVYSNSSINIKKFAYVNIDKKEKQNNVKYGDILFTISSETAHEVGISSVLLNHQNELYLNSFCFGLRLYNFETLCPVFAQHYFRGYDFRKQMTRIAQGASRYNLSKKYFNQTIIIIPPVNEQKAIAKVLSAADGEIEALGKKLALWKEQKKYLLNNLVTGSIRLPEFSESTEAR